MRRLVLSVLVLVLATAAGAATPYFLDRSGMLWKASASQQGLVLSGERDGAIAVRSVVPFPLPIAGSNDAQIQVAADELSGTVAVVWQRNWSDSTSEIIVALWRDGTWNRIIHLTDDLTLRPRNPLIQLSTVRNSVPDPQDGTGASSATVIEDSFLHVVWWQGNESQQGASYALVRLTSSADDSDAVVRRNLDSFGFLGLACAAPATPDILEHPLFADQAQHDRALVFFGASRTCLFSLLEISFTVATPPTADAGGGFTAIAQRRRNVPVFGVQRVFPVPDSFAMDGARMVVGADLNPVTYRLAGPGTLAYVVATDAGWSTTRTLSVKPDLTLDQAIPLLESLAR
jgi:hypothetical protein